MKIEKAIAILREVGVGISSDFKYSIEILLAVTRLAISALEKQIPKRPHADGNGSVEYPEDWLECPDCGEAIPEYTSENETDCYCVGCGQKLDWSDSNG